MDVLDKFTPHLIDPDAEPVGERGSESAIALNVCEKALEGRGIPIPHVCDEQFRLLVKHRISHTVVLRAFHAQEGAFRVGDEMTALEYHLARVVVADSLAAAASDRVGESLVEPNGDPALGSDESQSLSKV